jgi:hypothetical protein
MLPEDVLSKKTFHAKWLSSFDFLEHNTFYQKVHVDSQVVADMRRRQTNKQCEYIICSRFGPVGLQVDCLAPAIPTKTAHRLSGGWRAVATISFLFLFRISLNPVDRSHRRHDVTAWAEPESSAVGCGIIRHRRLPKLYLALNLKGLRRNSWKGLGLGLGSS